MVSGGRFQIHSPFVPMIICLFLSMKGVAKL